MASSNEKRRVFCLFIFRFLGYFFRGFLDSPTANAKFKPYGGFVFSTVVRHYTRQSLACQLLPDTGDYFTSRLAW